MGSILIENLESEKSNLRVKNSKLQEEKRNVASDLEILREELGSENSHSADMKNLQQNLKERIEELKNLKTIKDKTLQLMEDEKANLEEKLANLESNFESALRNSKNLEATKDKL